MFKDVTPARIDTLIGASVRVEGDLVFGGGLHLDGRVAGNVRAEPRAGSTLSVSESGSIEGSVEAHDLALRGTVRGDIVASGRVVLGPTARVEGNVHYGVIEVTLGAQISGKLLRLATPGADPGSP